MEEKNCVRRLGIFVFFDDEGIVDDYIPYLLNDMKENLEELIIVANGRLSPAGRRKFKEFTEHIVVRKNEGFDIGAWKYAMTEYWDWERIDEYDEIVLFNDTFFGPFYPFKVVFDEMEQRHVDFWGLTCHFEANDAYGKSSLGYWPTHIQSYFLVIGKKMHCGYEFKEYIKHQKIYHHIEDVIENHETVFTKYFEEKGFSWDIYVDLQDRCSFGTYDNYNIYGWESYYLISKKKYPILKKKNFTMPMKWYIQINTGNDLYQCLQYIMEYTNYSIDMIWKYILRKYNLSDLFDSIGLQYVFSLNSDVNRISQISKKTVVVVYVNAKEQIDFLRRYIEHIPNEIDIVIITKNEKWKNLLERKFSFRSNFHVNLVKCMEWFSFLMEIRKIAESYEYICLLYRKCLKEENPSTEEDYRKLIWNSLLGSKAYIYNILSMFERDNYLGMLVPPIPIHGKYSRFIGNRWNGKFQDTAFLAGKLRLNVPLEEGKHPISMGTSFWCRKNAIELLWKYPWLEHISNISAGKIYNASIYIIPYIVQNAGYYTAWTTTSRYAMVEARNTRYMVEQMVRCLRYHCKDFPGLNIEGLDIGYITDKDVERTVECIPENYYDHFFPYHLFRGREKILLYGAGNIGKQFYRQGIHDDYVNVVGIVDKNAHNIHESDIPVMPVESLRTLTFDYVLITMNRQDIAESAKEEIARYGIPIEKIKWDGDVYYRDHYYQKFYWKLMDRENPDRLNALDILNRE